MAMLLEPEFPLCLSYGSSSAPSYSTRIVGSGTGWEVRNADWYTSRNRFDAAVTVRSQGDLYELVEFFHAMRGAWTAFRFKDWLDYKSCAPTGTPAALDQLVVASATAGQNNIVLTKTYRDASDDAATLRYITQPKEDTVLVAVDSAVVDPADYTMTDGKIVLDTALTVGQTLHAGYEFFVPMRFEEDSMSTVLEAFQTGSTHVPIVEVRVSMT